MIVAIEHTQSSTRGAVTEIHCPVPYAAAIAGVVRRITGEHPVPVPVEDVIVYFVKGLDLEEACALLRMVTMYGEDPAQIDRSLLAAEAVLELQSRSSSSPTYDLDQIDACF